MHTCFGLCFQSNVSENLLCFYACFETSFEQVFMFSKCISKHLCIAYVLNHVFEVCFETFILCFETSFPNSYISKIIGVCFETSFLESYVSKLIGVCFETSFSESYVSKPTVVCFETFDSISRSFRNPRCFLLCIFVSI